VIFPISIYVSAGVQSETTTVSADHCNAVLSNTSLDRQSQFFTSLRVAVSLQYNCSIKLGNEGKHCLLTASGLSP
jgi:hypothetical protein